MDEPLPFDILDAVIKRTEDKSTLSACSQVSRLWRQASRPQVFRQVKITDGDRLAAFEGLLDSDPDIGGFVRELVLRPYHPPDEEIPLPTPWIARFPAILPSRLTKVVTMQLVQIYDYGEFLDHDFFPKLAGFTSVERLVVKDCFLVQHFIISLISSFSNLRHLHIGPCRPTANILHEPPLLLYQPHLISLKLEVGNKYPGFLQRILEWVLQPPSRTSLRSFSVVVHMMDAEAVGNLLRKIGNTLEELEIRLLKFVHARTEYESESGSPLLVDGVDGGEFCLQ